MDAKNEWGGMRPLTQDRIRFLHDVDVSFNHQLDRIRAQRTRDLRAGRNLLNVCTETEEAVAQLQKWRVAKLAQAQEGNEA